MAREHARVKLSIWEDDDYRDLSVEAQHLYQVLMIHPQLNYAGVADWRPGKLSGFARNWTAEDVELAAKELSEQRYIVIDERTEEVLIRSFIRSDELLDSPNMAVAVRKAHMAIASNMLRGVIVFELVRLRADKPDLKGWGSIGDLLGKASVNPSEIPSFNPSEKGSVNPSRTPSVNPSVKGSGNPEPIPSATPSVNPSGTPSPTTAPTPSPATATPPGRTEDQDLGGKRNETLQPARATKPPPTTATPNDARCTAHAGVAEPGPCRGCMAERERAERLLERELDRDQREAEARALACDRCDGKHVVDPDTKLPTRRKCDHRRTA